MSIKFWTPRHRAILYNIFDQVRLCNFGLLDSAFVGDMLDQKITQKAQRRIENEWLTYWEDVYAEEPVDKEKLLVYKINSNQFLLLKAGNATSVAKLVHEKYEDLFNARVGEIDEE
ncbi:hypothetical protein [Alteromonas sp. ASW11-130]|uniref:hypothetical protein n=1 Tax=Alteromonas sp. ASW11-130 TaxID=3015775 RepID=UPI002241F544|nr:hypothetical protein [Alteromonas sp. ASW11-130]MCW8091870.1 hypothetical protein [Alteromonas sp. ASW11-130]